MRATSRRQSAAPNLEAHIGYWMRAVSNQVSGAFARALHTRQTSIAEWVVLCRVAGKPGITPGELSETLHLTRGAVSKIIDKLEAKDWIVHSRNADDCRVQMLSVTRLGARILPQLAQIADRNDREFFGVLNAEEDKTLRRLLGKLAEIHAITDVPVE